MKKRDFKTGMQVTVGNINDRFTVLIGSDQNKKRAVFLLSCNDNSMFNIQNTYNNNLKHVCFSSFNITKVFYNPRLKSVTFAELDDKYIIWHE